MWCNYCIYYRQLKHIMFNAAVASAGRVSSASAEGSTCRTPTVVAIAAIAVGDPVNFTSAFFLLSRTQTQSGAHRGTGKSINIKTCCTALSLIKKVWGRFGQRNREVVQDILMLHWPNKQHDNSLSGCGCVKAVDSNESPTHPGFKFCSVAMLK